MENEMILIWVLLVLYILVSAYYTRIVIKSPLDRSKKMINILMVWVIPIVWGLLIKSMFKPITEKDKIIDKSNYYESGLGELL